MLRRKNYGGIICCGTPERAKNSNGQLHKPLHILIVSTYLASNGIRTVPPRPAAHYSAKGCNTKLDTTSGFGPRRGRPRWSSSGSPRGLHSPSVPNPHRFATATQSGRNRNWGFGAASFSRSCWRKEPSCRSEHLLLGSQPHGWSLRSRAGTGTS